jgi:hypothetical protein
MKTQRAPFMRHAVPGLVVAAVLAGCAFAPLPPAKGLQTSDLPRLAGAWEWSSLWETPARLGPGPMKVRVDDGKLRFETATTQGALTFHESDGRRVLNGTGTDKTNGRAFRVKLTQWGSGSDASRRSASAQLVLLVIE